MNRGATQSTANYGCNVAWQKVASPIATRLEKHKIREVLHADRRIAMQAADDYSRFIDVLKKEEGLYD